LVRLQKAIAQKFKQAHQSGNENSIAHAQGLVDTFHKQHGRTHPRERLKRATKAFKASLTGTQQGKTVYLTRPNNPRHHDDYTKWNITTERPDPESGHHTMMTAARRLARQPLLIEYGGETFKPHQTSAKFQTVDPTQSARQAAIKRQSLARQRLQGAKPQSPVQKRPVPRRPLPDAPRQTPGGPKPPPYAPIPRRQVASRWLRRLPLLYEFQSNFAVGTSVLGAPATKGATTTANLGLVAKGGEVFLGKKQLDLINKKFKTQEACYKWAGKNRKKQEKCDEIPVAVGGVQTGMAMLSRSKLKGV